MSVAKNWQQGNGRQVCWLSMLDITPNPHQPRKEFDEHALMELAASIRQHGLLQPITVRETQQGYEIVMGERRFRACEMLGFTHVDAFVLPIGEGESAVLALVENLQRENLHFFEEAEAYSVLLEQGINQEQLARQLGKSAGGIANKLRLLKLSPELRHYIYETGLSERHARCLLRLPDGMARLRIAQQAGENKLTVRETEGLVNRALARLPVQPPVRRVISLVRDHRLYLNAIQSIVEQMRETGLHVCFDVHEYEDKVDVRVTLPKHGNL